MTLRSLTLTRCAIRSPSFDVACGDGVFSFLHAGGAFDDAFDVFGAVGHLGRVTEQHADMFDAASDRFDPIIARPPDQQIDLGTDLKPELLRKADKLGLYRRLVEHDGNAPLPLSDEAFATVYCNSAYWIRAIDLFLRELRRVTRADGCIILHVKLASMRDYTLEAFGRQLGERFLRIIDRGRRECWPTVGTRRQWEERFGRAGLAIVEATPFATRTHAQIWDVGLRPIAPMLVRMADALSPDTRLAVKRDWVGLFLDLLEPLCRPDFDLFEGKPEPVEIQYVLKRK
jgi:SAM-dependent methyltransferase